jgi:hypothetical protein
VSEETGLKCIIPALTPVPVKRVQTHAITSEQSDITVELYEADGDSCGAPLLFGKVIIVIVTLVFFYVDKNMSQECELGTGEDYVMGRFKISVFFLRVVVRTTKSRMMRWENKKFIHNFGR